jgi:ABC-type glycerol-3-phosphate transport system permease component
MCLAASLAGGAMAGEVARTSLKVGVVTTLSGPDAAIGADLRDGFGLALKSLVEAAIVDGCNPGVTFIKIVFPLARNTIITIASMYSILIWNDFIFANTFISDSNAKTVAMGLKDYVGAFGNVDWGLTFAAIVISILPPLIIYFALNKWVTAGMTMGATKG